MEEADGDYTPRISFTITEPASLTRSEATYAGTPESTDYETLSPIPLSPYSGTTPGVETPVTDTDILSPTCMRTAETIRAASSFRSFELELLEAGNLVIEGHEKPKSAAEKESQKLPYGLDFVSLLSHLATFGILGVLIRYGVGEVFDKHIGNVTSLESSLFHDLPANMLGSYVMGWVGVVLKKEITEYSQLLALGLSTGLMGSITSYSSWLQKLIVIMTKGYWVRGIFGLLIGLELSLASLYVGMNTADLYKGCAFKRTYTSESYSRRQKSLAFFLFSSVLLWIGALTGVLVDRDSYPRRKLWLGCILGPPGVWLRWYLSRFNNNNSNRQHWLPLGTLSANLIACVTSFSLSVVLLAADRYEASLWVEGIQVGFLGCLSTVSTFVVEIYNLSRTQRSWRPYIYVCVSVVTSVVLGIAIYSSAVWAKGYHIL